MPTGIIVLVLLDDNKVAIAELIIFFRKDGFNWNVIMTMMEDARFKVQNGSGNKVIHISI